MTWYWNRFNRNLSQCRVKQFRAFRQCMNIAIRGPASARDPSFSYRTVYFGDRNGNFNRLIATFCIFFVFFSDSQEGGKNALKLVLSLDSRWMRRFVIYRPLALGCSLNLTPSQVISLGISRTRNADIEPFFVAYKEAQLYKAK